MAEASTSGASAILPDSTPAPTIAPFTSEDIVDTKFMQGMLSHLKDRFKNDPYFKWVLIGGSIYVVAHFSQMDSLILWPARKVVEFIFRKCSIPRSLIVWAGEVEPEIPFGRLGYTRCLEADEDVLEKFGIPMNSEKCLRDGITYLPGEFYQQFDLNEFDPKVTPLAWSYGPITDPSLIMPTGWYNDMSGVNQEYELFCKFMRIFGYLPEEAYTELYNHCKIKLLRSSQRLIKIGDPDDKVYIIVNGAVDVYSNHIGPHGDFVRLRTAMQGGQISSLFSIIDAISGNARHIRSVYAVAKLNTTKVLIFPMAALKDYLVRNQEYLVSAVVRLLERGYRFQYQILHKAMQLTNFAGIKESERTIDRPEVEIPSEAAEISKEMRADAIVSFTEFMGFEDLDFFKKHCKVRLMEPEEQTNDKSIIQQSVLNKPETAYKYVYAGKLEEFHLKSNLGPMEKQSRRKHIEEVVNPETLIYVSAGEGVGGLTGILGYFNELFCRCVERSIIVTISQDSLHLLMKRKPLAILQIAYMAVFRMTFFIRAMDFATEWTIAKEGQYIFHKEQMCYNSYLILSGRARAYQLDSELHQRAIVEYKENDWIGLIESLLQSKRRTRTCVVIRETEFVKIPNDLLRNILINYSSAAQVMLNFLVGRSLKRRKLEFFNELERPPLDSEYFQESRRIRSIALVPVSENLPYSVLAVEIKRHYETQGTCIILTYEKTLAALKLDELTIKDQFALEMYILQQLEKCDLVIFICLPRMHYWNEISSSHSEVMFTVGCSELPNIPTQPSDFEEEIVGRKISSRRKELIILHHMDVQLPRNTKEWLYCRDWLHFHHHIRLPNEAFSLLGAIKEEDIAGEYPALNREMFPTSDLSRFIRWLQGRTFGVLFSSGGARIGAQLGMLHALLECKYIPVDMVVGTGSGFLLAALYAVYHDYATVQKIIEKIFKDFNQTLTKLHWDDITFPYINLGNGKRLLTYFYQMFGSVQLEDTWIPICCVTTNLTSQDVRVDRSGPLWVYIRASLSHINSSPPICDPVDGDYICDGAHANSLPQDIIKEFGAEYIIAFNTVGGKADEDSDTKADPNVSIMRFINNSISAFMQQLGLANPTFETVFNQLALTQTRMYAAGVEAVSNLKHIVYVRPPVEHWHSRSWTNLQSLHRIGYFYMKAILDKNPYREDIPFFIFWSNLKATSKDMASEGGRDLNNFNVTVN